MEGVGKNKQARKRLAGLERRIRFHEEKLRREKGKSSPDFGLIAHWETEIRGWRQERHRLLRRLP